MAAEAYNPDNIFKKIIDGVIPSYKIFETEDCVAILDAFPCTNGHSLLLPKHPYARVEDMPEDVAARFLGQLPRLVRAVKLATGAEGVNIIANSGAAAGQVVHHVHFHVVPRIGGDGLLHHPKSQGMIAKEAAEETLEALKKVL